MVFRQQNLLMGSLALGLICAPLAASQSFGAAQELRLESAGLRFGVPANESGADFHQFDAVAEWNTPWAWDMGRRWWMRVQAAVSAGWLGDPGHNAFIGSAGPAVVLGRGDFPLKFEGGLSPTFISLAEFGSKNFGSNAQFTSYAGVNANLGAVVQLSYRFQHMSNGGLSSHNPGLNLHMFGVSYQF